MRPSGTEPKLKVYLEVIEPVSSDLKTARQGRRHEVGRASAPPWKASSRSEVRPRPSSLVPAYFFQKRFLVVGLSVSTGTSLGELGLPSKSCASPSTAISCRLR